MLIIISSAIAKGPLFLFQNPLLSSDTHKLPIRPWLCFTHHKFNRSESQLVTLTSPPLIPPHPKEFPFNFSVSVNGVTIFPILQISELEKNYVFFNFSGHLPSTHSHFSHLLIFLSKFLSLFTFLVDNCWQLLKILVCIFLDSRIIFKRIHYTDLLEQLGKDTYRYAYFNIVEIGKFENKLNVYHLMTGIICTNMIRYLFSYMKNKIKFILLLHFVKQ